MDLGHADTQRQEKWKDLVITTKAHGEYTCKVRDE